MFAVASVTGSVQIYQGSGRDYSLANEIKEIQVCAYIHGQRLEGVHLFKADTPTLPLC